MHILAVIILNQHSFCINKGKRKLKLLIILCTFCTFGARLSVFVLLCRCLINIWKKVYNWEGRRGGEWGREGGRLIFFSFNAVWDFVFR